MAHHGVQKAHAHDGLMAWCTRLQGTGLHHGMDHGGRLEQAPDNILAQATRVQQHLGRSWRGVGHQQAAQHEGCDGQRSAAQEQLLPLAHGLRVSPIGNVVDLIQERLADAAFLRRRVLDLTEQVTPLPPASHQSGDHGIGERIALSGELLAGLWGRKRHDVTSLDDGMRHTIESGPVCSLDVADKRF